MINNQNISCIISRTMAALCVLALMSSCDGGLGSLPGEKELLGYKNATASKVLSSDGQLVGKIYHQNRTNVIYNQVPEHLVNALIATEDVRFYQHRGVDSRSLLRVLIKTVIAGNRSSGGGSTITQQLAKNMYGRQHRGLFSVARNKSREMILARRIENTYSKEEILTLYLNTVPFGEDVFGIETAALRYFNKKVEDLYIEESAVLTGLLKAPSFYNPARNPDNAKRRRNIVLSQMEKYNFIDSAEADSLRNLPLTLDYRNPASEGIAGYFMVRLGNELNKILEKVEVETGKLWNPETDGLIIETSLNMSLQTSSVEAFRKHLPQMQSRLTGQYLTPSGKSRLEDITEQIIRDRRMSSRANDLHVQTLFRWEGSYSDSISVRDSIRHALPLLHAGMLAIDPRTGGIMAWVGGIDHATQPYDQILARRQMGSVFKPVLYAAALENGSEPCDYLDNDSVMVSGYDEWSPDNFDGTLGGSWSLTASLAKSMNVPSFNLFIKTGFGPVDSLWKALGFSFSLRNTPSLPLGTAEASILETAVAYSVFANGGYKIDPWSVSTVKSPSGELIYTRQGTIFDERIISERTGFLLGAILQKAVNEGTGAAVRSRFGVDIPLAGKTGTTQNYADAWFAAFNPGIIIVARAGASLPAIHFDEGSYGTGSSLALPLVALALKKATSVPELRQQVDNPFPELPPDLSVALECPDFREDTFVDKFIDIFRKPGIVFDTTGTKSDRRIRSVIRRIFRR